MSEITNPETPCPDTCPDRAFANHEQMHELYGQPLVYGLKMHIPYIHEHHKTFIAHSSFLVLTSSDRNGYPRAMPRASSR